MVTTRLMTADDLLHVPPDAYRYDLIRGELQRMPLAGSEHGATTMEFGALVANHVIEHGLGQTFAAKTGFCLARDPDTVLGPDVSFVCADRLPPRSQWPAYLPLAPDLAVEVLSPSNRAADVQTKVNIYLEAGVLLVLVVDIGKRTITVHAPGQPAQLLEEGDTFDGGQVLPGFRLPVADLFGE